jgi:RNA polymerase sigma-70 factor (ECF subfamily)
VVRALPIDRLGDVRMVPAGANRQPAVAGYIRPPGEAAYHPTGLTVLRVEAGEIAEVTTFSPAPFSAFDLS